MIYKELGKTITNFLVFCLCLFLGCPSVYAGHINRALIVGISEYPENSGWQKLHCNNDVDLLKTTLKHYGISGENIIILQNGNATKDSIINAIKQITEHTQIGDTVFVFFSGHGQLVIDKQKNTYLDESIIPFDACVQPSKYESTLAEKHIRDVEYGNLIQGIAKKVGMNGLVVAVIDACHSDSMDKGARESLPKRGVHDVFGFDSKLADSVKVLREERNDVVHRPNGTGNIIYIAACQSYENNYEYLAGNKYYGRLIYSFCRVLPSIIWNSTIDSINSPLKKKFYEITDIDNQHIAIRTTYLPSESYSQEETFNWEDLLAFVVIIFVLFQVGVTFYCIKRLKYQSLENKFVIRYLKVFFAVFDNKFMLTFIFAIIVYLIYSLIKYLEWL